MRDEWKHIKLEIVPYKDTETHILQGVQPIWDMLDEQIQKTMLIASSPYVKFLLQDVLYWKGQLVKIQEVLEEWSKAQRGWLYLYPIFMAGDIQDQLPEVSNTFGSVDKMWRVVMSGAVTNPFVIEATQATRAYENL